MIKKLLLVAAIVVGLVYGSGNDFGSIRHQITSTSDDNARGLTGRADDSDWGDSEDY